jgi:hypothetical protein
MEILNSYASAFHQDSANFKWSLLQKKLPLAKLSAEGKERLIDTPPTYTHDMCHTVTQCDIPEQKVKKCHKQQKYDNWRIKHHGTM